MMDLEAEESQQWQYLRESLEMYRDHRIHPGGCLTAFLSNDLRGFLASADAHTLASVKAIYTWCRNELPHIAWGSGDHVVAWLDGGRCAHAGVEASKKIATYDEVE